MNCKRGEATETKSKTRLICFKLQMSEGNVQMFGIRKIGLALRVHQVKILRRPATDCCLAPVNVNTASASTKDGKVLQMSLQKLLEDDLQRYSKLSIRYSKYSRGYTKLLIRYPKIIGLK